MYTLQEEPDERILMVNLEIAHPVATLADEYGGRAQIVVDDHCYVLHLKQEGGQYGHTAWWFKEAVEALRKLPTNPTDAEIPVLRKVMENAPRRGGHGVRPTGPKPKPTPGPKEKA